MQENKPESTVLIKQDIRVIKQTLFPSFLEICTADTKALFAPLKPAAERGGERLGGDSFADPSPGLLETLPGK